MHPRDGVVVVVNVRNGLHQKVAGKVGWPENWWPTLIAPQLRCLGLSCPATLARAYACSPFLLGTLLGVLWPLFKRRRRGGLWAVQAIVPGNSLGDLSLVAWGIGARGSNGSRVSKDPLRP